MHGTQGMSDRGKRVYRSALAADSIFTSGAAAAGLGGIGCRPAAWALASAEGGTACCMTESIKANRFSCCADASGTAG